MLFVLKWIEEIFQYLNSLFHVLFYVSKHPVNHIPEKGDISGAQKEWYSQIFPQSHLLPPAKNVQLIAQGNVSYLKSLDCMRLFYTDHVQSNSIGHSI